MEFARVQNRAEPSVRHLPAPIYPKSCTNPTSDPSGWRPHSLPLNIGGWKVPGQCTERQSSVSSVFAECQPGYFKAAVPSEKCELCPANTQGTGYGDAACPCTPGFYRAEDDPPTGPCSGEITALPEACPLASSVGSAASRTTNNQREISPSSADFIFKYIYNLHRKPRAIDIHFKIR